ncbi:MAG TPA: hypothetical protein PLA25_09960 [Anaerolineaceae bacterium]|nr:hypothetical protein [Longilinea sp.]HQH85956.1 hypothetical protein [Anaerolineaceae bacterium]HQN44450.1 hypothetical protein [Anaerolineaceae bacterium]
MSQSFHLYQIQKIDTQLDQIEARRAEITSILEKDVRMRNAQKHLDEAHVQVHQLQHALREMEEITRAKRIKIEQSEAALYGGSVRSPKELQDLQTEVASLKKHLATLEDQQLEKMMQLEAAEAQQAEAQRAFDELDEQLISEYASLNGEKSQLERQRERLNAERTVISGQISAENLEVYQRLRQQKKGQAVVPIEDESCGVCGATLTPAECQAAKSPLKIIFCSACGRILYAG